MKPDATRWSAGGGILEVPGNVFPGNGNSAGEAGLRNWSGKVGQQALELIFWKACLQSIEEQRMLQV